MTALSLDRTNLDMRRGACPTLSAPMRTGDGLLSRIALTEPVAPSQLAAVCRLAEKYGNGIIDISARGNLQVRGLNETTALLLESDIRAMLLPLREGLAVEVPPLAGLDETEIADPRPLAEAIRDGARGIGGLAPKMSVVVDGSGRFGLSELLADIRLVAIRTENDIRWQVLLGGTEAAGRVHGIHGEADAVSETLALLRRLGSLGEKARGRDLATDAMPLKKNAGNTSTPFELIPLEGGLFALGIGPAFGQMKAAMLAALCLEAEQLGIRSVTPAAGHCLLFFGSNSACRHLSQSAELAGFITSPTDARSMIAACPGSPACTSAMLETHALAATVAVECLPLLDGSFTLHVSGCPKGCAHPHPSALTLYGTPDGLSLTTGTAAEQPYASISKESAASSLRRLADLVQGERRIGENSAACLARLGPDRLAAHLTSGQP